MNTRSASGADGLSRTVLMACWMILAPVVRGRYAAEQAGLKLAIKGRVITLIILGVLLVSTRSAEQAVKFGLAVTGFLVLGLCHFYVIGTVWDKRWTKYLFLSYDDCPAGIVSPAILKAGKSSKTQPFFSVS